MLKRVNLKVMKALIAEVRVTVEAKLVLEGVVTRVVVVTMTTLVEVMKRLARAKVVTKSQSIQ